jgi:predicted nucleic acid-binding protein
MKVYVLDSFAVIAYMRKETGADKVRALLAESFIGKTELALSVVNAGEAYYMLYKKESAAKADLFWRNLPRLPIRLYPATTERTFSAAYLKAIYPTGKNQISYADCYATALAEELGATLVTGDPEFQLVEHRITIEWLK